MIKVNLLDSVTERSQSGAAVVEAKVANPAARFWMLGAAVGALLGLAMVFDYYSASASQAKAKQELERQQQVAAQMAAINKEQAEFEKKIGDIQTRIEAIKVLRASQQGPVSLLSAMNERLPPVADFRLESVEQKGGELTIEGHSPNEHAVTQFGRSLEFSSDLFQNVSMEVERKDLQIDKGDLKGEALKELDPDYRPQTVAFKLKCRYGPSQPPADQKAPATKEVAAKR